MNNLINDVKGSQSIVIDFNNSGSCIIGGSSVSGGGAGGSGAVIAPVPAAKASKPVKPALTFKQLNMVELNDIEFLTKAMKQWQAWDGDERSPESLKFMNQIEKVRASDRLPDHIVVLKQLSNIEKENIDLVREHYDAIVAVAGERHKEAIVFQNHLLALEDAQVAKEISAVIDGVDIMFEDSDKQKAYVKAYEEVLYAIGEYDVYYIVPQNRYYYSFVYNDKITVRSSPIEKQGIKNKLQIGDLYKAKAFEQIMQSPARTKDMITASFEDCSDNIYNLMSRDGWLEPNLDDTEYHPIFDMLMASLTGGRADYQDHLELVLAMKYLRPSEYRLPSITWYGRSASAGKNTFIEQVVRTIFGKSQVNTIGFDKISGEFNDMLVGQTVILFDEISANKSDTNRMKQMNGNESLNINPKGTKPYCVDNTSLKFYSCNGAAASVVLGGGHEDRRYTPIELNHDMGYWIKQFHDDGKIVVKNPDDGKWYDWFNEHYWVLSDRDEVAKWFGACMIKHDALIEQYINTRSYPVAYHGECYTKLRNNQGGAFTDVLLRVFSDGFSNIQLKELYAYYQAVMAAEYPGQDRYKKGFKLFNEDVENFIRERNLPIERKAVRVRDRDTRIASWQVLGTKGSLPETDKALYLFSAFGEKNLRDEIQWEKCDGYTQRVRDGKAKVLKMGKIR